MGSGHHFRAISMFGSGSIGAAADALEIARQHGIIKSATVQGFIPVRARVLCKFENVIS
jgi:hypothetical protein